MVGELRDQRTSTAISRGSASEVADFAAELTEAAYPVALQRKPGKRWLELQLDLWHAMERTIREWQGD